MRLSIQNLSKTYKNGVKALDNISLEITTGMFGLLGPNGAGKSSMMRTIATLQEPDTGSIHLDSIDILDDPMSLRKQLGYLPQEFGVYPKISALELLSYFATLKGITNKKERNDLVDSLLEITNLTDVRRKSVSDYSGGMKQRFGIAQMLLNKPKLIIVDEPTAGLDPAERRRFLTVLREIGQDNIVIFSTHIVEDVQELCNDMAIMNQGKILHRSSPDEAVTQLANKVWVTKTTREEVERIQEKYQVLSSTYNNDNTMNIRAYGQDAPDASFTSVQATLEDVYFVHLHGYNL
ncbi:MAG: ABC-type multidrug transport system ATPase subunit [Saprospiraceae bacterium]|jgi:ABC-type multidrug transport system ATPase subunit